MESSLAPAETEGPTIPHHFAFSLPPLTQTVPRNRCVLPGSAMARRMTASRRACAVRMLWADPTHHFCCPRREPAPWQPRFTSCLLVCPHEVCSPFSCKPERHEHRLLGKRAELLAGASAARSRGSSQLPSERLQLPLETRPLTKKELRQLQRGYFSLFSIHSNQLSSAVALSERERRGGRGLAVCTRCWRSSAHCVFHTQRSPPGFDTFTTHQRLL